MSCQVLDIRPELAEKYKNKMQTSLYRVVMGFLFSCLQDRDTFVVLADRPTELLIIFLEFVR